MHKLLLPLFFAAALTAPAQRFSFGVKGGVPVTSAIPGDYSPYFMVDTGRWTVGPTAEARLFHNLSFEFDALFRGYREQGSSAIASIASGTNVVPLVSLYSVSRTDAREWDLPFLLKYRFQAGPVRPFVDAGYEASHVSSDYTYTLSCLSTADVCNSSGLAPYFRSQANINSTVNRRGEAAGVGVEFKYGRFKIAPEVRYSRLTRPNANNVTVLVGFTF